MSTTSRFAGPRFAARSAVSPQSPYLRILRLDVKISILATNHKTILSLFEIFSPLRSCWNSQLKIGRWRPENRNHHAIYRSCDLAACCYLINLRPPSRRGFPYVSTQPHQVLHVFSKERIYPRPSPPMGLCRLPAFMSSCPNAGSHPTPPCYNYTAAVLF